MKIDQHSSPKKIQNHLELLLELFFIQQISKRDKKLCVLMNKVN